MGSSIKMFDYLKEASILKSKADKLPPAELEGKIVIGEFQEIEKTVLSEEMEKIRQKVQGGG